MPDTVPVIVARAFDPVEARILTHALRADGLSATMVWAETLGNDWSMMLALGGIAISVPAAEAVRAADLLGAIPAGAPLRFRWRIILLAFALSLPLFTLPALPLRLRAEWIIRRADRR